MFPYIAHHLPDVNARPFAAAIQNLSTFPDAMVQLPPFGAV